MKKKEKSANNIGVAFFLNLFFSIIELAGGIFTNSISIISDSIHDFGDAISIGIAWLLEKKSNKKPDSRYTYGYARYSVLGALITSIVLTVGSIVMLYNAIHRIINPQYVKYDGMLILGIIGLLVNGIGALVTSKGEKLNEKSINSHLLEDLLGWIAVLVISLVMKIFDMPILDPILSIGITVFILYHVFRNLKEVFEIFLEKAPKQVDFEEFKNELIEENEQIIEIHHTHVWTLDGNNTYITMHVLVKNDISTENIILLKKQIKEEAKEHNINHVTIEIEYEKEKCENGECEVEENHEHHGHHHHHHHH